MSVTRTARRRPRGLGLAPLRIGTTAASYLPTPDAARTVSRRRQIAHFVVHFLEMCAPMCIGFVIGDIVYFWAAAQQGYDEPFRQLPELSVLVVTFTMTAPMTVWMLFRGMPHSGDRGDVGGDPRA